MTLFILAVFSALAIAVLLWCFRGFSRELKGGRKVIGVVVRVETTGGEKAVRSHAVRHTANVVEMTRTRVLRPGGHVEVSKAQ